ncbi:MAG: ParB/RepB/Spo0J family partition protein [Bacteroidales bacterium]|nr:ParB/RepB/Spo0J family partition protein [Bacteroidales bacterium]
MKTKRPAMGRGLKALLNNQDEEGVAETSPVIGKQDLYLSGSVAMLPLDQISTNPYQPRTIFEEQALNELAESIKKLGIIQPITVRKLGHEKYQLISGERRFKAAKLAKLKEIPVYIRSADDIEMLEMALVENIQRENLDPIEIAVSYQRLIEECQLTQEQLSETVGKDRSTISNFLRLLKLPAEIQIGLRNNKISVGHARSLVSISDLKIQLKIFNEIIDNELSVRKTEEIVSNYFKQQSENNETENKNRIRLPLPAKYEKALNLISDKFETEVQLKRSKNGKGSIIIKFASEDDFERIFGIIDK